MSVIFGFFGVGGLVFCFSKNDMLEEIFTERSKTFGPWIQIVAPSLTDCEGWHSLKTSFSGSHLSSEWRWFLPGASNAAAPLSPRSLPLLPLALPELLPYFSGML